MTATIAQILTDFGVLDVVVPFTLSFAVTWGLLERTLVLGKEKDGKSKKKLNIIVALSIAMFTVLMLRQSLLLGFTVQMMLYIIFTLFALFFIAGIVFGGNWREQTTLKVVALLIVVGVIAFLVRLDQVVQISSGLIFALFALAGLVFTFTYLFRETKETSGGGKAKSKPKNAAPQAQTQGQNNPQNQADQMFKKLIDDASTKASDEAVKKTMDELKRKGIIP